jgi:hypothetical protein
MTKCNKILGSLAILGLSAMMMVSCGGGSSSSGKKLASNDVFGDLPSLKYQYENQDSELKAKAKDEQKNLPFNESGLKKAKAIDEKYAAKRKATKEKFAADVEKLKPSLIGKAIPYEVEEGAPFEITSCKIVELFDSGSIRYEFELKITDAKAIQPNWSNEFWVFCDYLDKDGNKFDGNSSGVVIPREEKVDGATFTHQEPSSFSSPEKYVNFAKIRFLAKK